MILAWLLLLTGLTISAVAIYYSVVGLAAIFSAAVIPIIVMGSALEVAKLVCASWLKANWTQAPRLMKVYMTTAVVVLMLITSMGIFGFLSKAHSDQSLISGDVQSKIAIYDEKIKTAKDNIEANRKQLKQMDEAVDQIMGRSSDEKGADKANAVRKSQIRDRQALAKDIETNQKLVASLNDEAAPIRAEVRKVEAEVGPLKYIAAFVYGATDESVLERAVTWVIITIIVVFDPLAVIMLLAAQMTFGWKKEEEVQLVHSTVPVAEEKPDDLFPTYEEITPEYEADDGPLTEEQIDQLKATVAQFHTDKEPFDFSKHPYLFTPAGSFTPPGVEPVGPQVYKPEPASDPALEPCYKCGTPLINAPGIGPFCPNKECDVVDGWALDEPFVITITETAPVTVDSTVVTTDEPKFQILPELEDLKKKTTYMIKTEGQQVSKTKEESTFKTQSNPTEHSGND